MKVTFLWHLVQREFIGFADLSSYSDAEHKIKIVSETTAMKPITTVTNSFLLSSSAVNAASS